MNLMVAIPDDLAERLGAEGEDIARCALEAFAADQYQARRVTGAEVRRMLGFATPMALDDFLKERGLYEPYDMADFERERSALDKFGW